MEFDAESMTAAETRAVETVEREGRPAKVVVATRRYPTSIEDLWDALTTIERIPRWFLPITGDLRVGGRFELEGNAGGEIVSCDPPRRFEITWEYGGDVSWVTVELRGEDGGEATELELRHVAYVPDDDWAEYGPGAVGLGWDMGLLGLHRHVTTGAAIDRAEAEAWQSSPNYRDCIERASAAWRDASIAGGTEAQRATDAAERVAAAYTATT
jgi:uncharacterized protein YndB with AHSA1/START domain